jgi:two-component system response regulator (stage 0 sporulation protein A)
MKTAVLNVDALNIKTSREIKQYDLNERITLALLIIGIPEHIKGYNYLYEAVKIVARSHNSVNRITKELYPMIAKSFGTRPSCVERAIRYAIHIAWTEGQMSHVFYDYTYNNRKKPSNGKVISLLADKFVANTR